MREAVAVSIRREELRTVKTPGHHILPTASARLGHSQPPASGSLHYGHSLQPGIANVPWRVNDLRSGKGTEGGVVAASGAGLGQPPALSSLLCG